MNNLKKLRDELKLKIRGVEEYTDISYAVISLLETDKRTMREAHIQALTSFFSVTSDYLLGKSEFGYIVYPKGEDDETVISEQEYFDLKRRGKVELEIIKLNTFEATILEEGKEPRTIYQPPYKVIRTVDFGQFSEKRKLLEELQELGKEMSVGQLVNTIDFIKKYIL